MIFIKKTLFVIIPGLVVYFSSLKYGFSQDDFIFLYISKVNNLMEFLNFFNPLAKFPDLFFYRPLTTQVYFSLNQNLFGLNPLPFRIEALILHLINAVLFYFVVKKVWKDEKVALLSSGLYSLSAVHFLSLFYIAAFQQIGATFFVLLSTLAFFAYRDGKKKGYYLLSLAAFVGALFSKETSLILPLLLLFLEFLRREKEKIILVSKDTFRKLVPYFLIIPGYLILRWVGFQSTFGEGSYNFDFSLSAIFQNIKWYILWVFGLPEVLSSYPSLKPQSLILFSQDFVLGKYILVLFFIVAGCMILLFKGSQLSAKSILLSCSIFFSSIISVLFLKDHRYPHYLDLPLLAVIPLIVIVFTKTTSFYKYVGMGGLLAFILLQIFSLKLSETYHWTTHRAKVAENYRGSFLKQYPNITEGSTIIFVGSQKATRELSFALAQKYALMVWYPGKTKEVWYNKPEDIITQPPNSIIYHVIVY